MIELILVRHGQTDWNLQRRVMGNEPIGLNDTGVKQVQALASALGNLSLDAIYASPLLRTQQSAEILAQNFQNSPVLHPALREIEYGVWVGKTFDEVRSQAGYVDPYLNPHLPVCEGGESLHAVRDRAIEFIQTLQSQHEQGRIMLVSHADWIKTVLLHYLNLPLQQIRQLRIDNASISYMTIDQHLPRVLSVNHSPGFEKLFVTRTAF